MNKKVAIAFILLAFVPIACRHGSRKTFTSHPLCPADEIAEPAGSQEKPPVSKDSCGLAQDKRCAQAAKKKKVAIAWSKGGGAHKSMLDALRTYLCPEYELIAFNPLERFWGKLDPLRALTFGYIDGEDFYNCLLARDFRWVINRAFCFGTSSMRRHTRYIEDQLENYFRIEKPDIIISVIPVLNYALNEAARRVNKPFLMVAPDCDTTHYLTDMYPTRPFFCTLPFDDDLLRAAARNAWIPEHFIKAYGFPLRLDFFEPKDRVQIRKNFGVPDGKPVVMILMGATGSSKSVAYLKHLAKMDMSLHLIICIGKNEGIRKTIERIKFPPSITNSIIGFTRRISDLMSISDVLITKAGATTLCEAVEMRLPLIIDHVSTALEIERMQPAFVKKHELGEVLTSYRDLPGVLTRLLTDYSYKNGIRERMALFSSRAFPQKIKRLIKHILKESEEGRYTPEPDKIYGFRWLRPG